MLPEERMQGGLWGAIVGDALGVPVEFEDRQTLRDNPVSEMRQYGTHHQPLGTWSDDSSMLLCTVESLIEGFDTRDLGHRFVRWYRQGYWTPWGDVFDVGSTTSRAIRNLAQGTPPEEAGLADEKSIGNGSLMRILPIALYAATASATVLDMAHRASRLTHAHPRAQVACGLYCLVAVGLLEGAEPVGAYHQAIDKAAWYQQWPSHSAELTHFARFLSGSLAQAREEDIKSTGYAVDTLEASLWCLLNSDSFEEAVLRAVNLGEDTDTTGTVTGGLAGLRYGLAAIPERWLSSLARREDISRLFDRFVSSLNS